MNFSLTGVLAAFSLSLSFATASSTEGKEGYQVKLGTDWRPYGLYSPKSGFGYNVEAAKIIFASDRSEFTVGSRIAYYPNQRGYGWTDGSRTFEYANENRLYYAGIPLAARYHFSSGQFAPFIEFKNSLDVRVLQQTDYRDFEPTCFGGSPFGGSGQTCIDENDFREVAKNRLFVWRQALALGIRIRLRETSILLSEGVLWDVIPGRESTTYSPPTRGFYLSTTAGISF